MQREENGLTGHNFQYAEKRRSEGTPFLFWQPLYLDRRILLSDPMPIYVHLPPYGQPYSIED
jgi:hypothetical protein